ncbi:hypothetical protein [Thermodesulfovibrio yellowstonii]|uniref:hypothetical protein n=1 Tax=Thermodesulfovibrio yellowstonii TaxID=28262 RepID=UPI00040DBD65|nr:hypothetical protein [Thermodesulfovibrio islandicus]
MEKWLINISNHPSEKWEKEQKQGWDRIIDVPFPKIDPTWDVNTPDFLKELIDVEEQVINVLLEANSKAEVFVMLQGEFSFCYMLFDRLRSRDRLSFAIPTTDRAVKEARQPDGTVVKQAQFKFVRWRAIE